MRAVPAVPAPFLIAAVARDGGLGHGGDLLFRIPADTGFDPTQPWRLQLLVNRSVGARDKVFTTFDLGWQPPPPFLRTIAAPAAEAESTEAAPAAETEDAPAVEAEAIAVDAEAPASDDDTTAAN